MKAKNNELSLDAGKYLAKTRDQVVADWARRTHEALSGARQMDRPTLVNEAPELIDQLATELSKSRLPEDGRGAADPKGLGRRHGLTRAVQGPYDPVEVVHEYQLLREVIFDHLGRRFELTRAERALVQAFMDRAIRGSVEAFTGAQAEFREHFNATLARDLRGNLGVVRMAAEIALDQTADLGTTRSLLGRVRASALRAERTVQNIIDLSVLRAGGQLRLEVRRVDLRGVVKAAATRRMQSSGDRFDLQLSSIGGWWADAALARALETLFALVIRHGAAGAPTKVEVVAARERARVVVRAGREIVIPDETYQPVITRARSRRREYARRLTHGLILVRGIVEAQGGELIIERATDWGTSFTMDLPLDARPFQPKP